MKIEIKTISETEALRLMRECFRSSSSVVRKTLRALPNVPMHWSKCPGWSYYVVSDSVKYTGYVAGGN